MSGGIKPVEDRYYEEKFSNIDKHLERHDGEIKEVQTTANKLDKDYAVMFERITIAIESLNELSKDNRETNIAMQQSLSSLNTEVKNLKEDVEEIKENTSGVDSLKCRMDKVEEKVESADVDDKISIRQFIKDKIVWVIVGVLALVALGGYGISKLTGLLP